MVSPRDAHLQVISMTNSTHSLAGRWFAAAALALAGTLLTAPAAAATALAAPEVTCQDPGMREQLGRLRREIAELRRAHAELRAELDRLRRGHAGEGRGTRGARRAEGHQDHEEHEGHGEEHEHDRGGDHARSFTIQGRRTALRGFAFQSHGPREIRWSGRPGLQVVRGRMRDGGGNAFVLRRALGGGRAFEVHVEPRIHVFRGDGDEGRFRVETKVDGGGKGIERALQLTPARQDSGKKRAEDDDDDADDAKGGDAGQPKTRVMRQTRVMRLFGGRDDAPERVESGKGGMAEVRYQVRKGDGDDDAEVRVDVQPLKIEILDGKAEPRVLRLRTEAVDGKVDVDVQPLRIEVLDGKVEPRVLRLRERQGGGEKAEREAGEKAEKKAPKKKISVVV